MPRPASPLRIWLWLSGLLVIAGLLHILGAGAFSFAEMVRALFAGPGADPSQVVLWDLRMPRLAAAALVGGGLGVVGTAFQALFRNPLADP